MHTRFCVPRISTPMAAHVAFTKLSALRCRGIYMSISGRVPRHCTLHFMNALSAVRIVAATSLVRHAARTAFRRGLVPCEGLAVLPLAGAPIVRRLKNCLYAKFFLGLTVLLLNV